MQGIICESPIVLVDLKLEASLLLQHNTFSQDYFFYSC